MTLTRTNSDNSAITPGLLSVMRTAVGLRFGIIALGAVLLLLAGLLNIERLPIGDNFGWLIVLLFIEAALLLAAVMWPMVRRRLGRWFMPLVLVWMLVTPVLQTVLVVTYMPIEDMFRPGRAGPANIGFEVVWLFIPVILAAWQYGRRGWLASIAILATCYGLLITALFMRGTDSLQFYAAATVGWLATITLIGWIVTRLVEANQVEHAAQEAANRRLAQRAATVEQLAESRERNRLARELHDTLAHSLTGVSVQLQALETLMKYDPEGAAAQLQLTQVTVREGIQEARRAIEALRATPLADLGLCEALRQMCSKWADRTGLRFICEIDDVSALDPLTEQAVYRVAETTLANIEQHASATEVRMRLTAVPRLFLQIQDNGIGFDPSIVPADRYGLTGMAAELVGAALTVESVPGQGTRVRMEVGREGDVTC